MFNRILVIGATGLLGRPVVERMTEGGHSVRILTRSAEKAHRMFGDAVEIAEGSATNIDDVRSAMAGCDAVHINLSPATEYTATSHVIEVADGQLGRLGYVSATTLSEDKRWFYRVDVKMRTEQLVRESGLPYAIFCPTWVMETLQNFIRGGKWALSVDGKNPPPLHFPPACYSPFILGRQPTSVDTPTLNKVGPGNPFHNPFSLAPPTGLPVKEQTTGFYGPSVTGKDPCSTFQLRQQIGNFLYVADRVRGEVVVFNSNRMTVIDRIAVPDPTALAMSPNLAFLAISNLVLLGALVIALAWGWRARRQRQHQ